MVPTQFPSFPQPKLGTVYFARDADAGDAPIAVKVLDRPGDGSSSTSGESTADGT
ncbi:MAG: hypothetical protein JNK99_12885, partial [Candidatus Accumulibacter sp.]|nr:hypothetical protein [Accumulibacter sp.]